MKRQVQYTGVRKWMGDDFLSIQDELFDALEGFFSQYEKPFVLSGCEKDGDDVIPGIVLLKNFDTNKLQLVRFPGATAPNLPARFLVSKTVDQRLYLDNQTKPVTEIYTAHLDAGSSEGLYIATDGTVDRWHDVQQDGTHRFVTEQEKATYAGQASSAVSTIRNGVATEYNTLAKIAAILGNIYSKTQVDEMLNDLGVDEHDHDSSYYSKTQVDSMLESMLEVIGELDFVKPNDLTGGETMTGTNVDFTGEPIQLLTLTADTELTFSNLLPGRKITLVVAGNFILTLPSIALPRITRAYDPSKKNLIELLCTSTNEVWYEIFNGTAADTDDYDGDGYSDDRDAFPLDETEHLDTDNDGIGNNADTDDDDDGYLDTEDAFPLDETEHLDTDNDGIGNNADTDDDDDGYLDTEDALPLDDTEHLDSDNDGIGDNADVHVVNFTAQDIFQTEDISAAEVTITPSAGGTGVVVAAGGSTTLVDMPYDYEITSLPSEWVANTMLEEDLGALDFGILCTRAGDHNIMIRLIDADTGAAVTPVSRYTTSGEGPQGDFYGGGSKDWYSSDFNKSFRTRPGNYFFSMSHIPGTGVALDYSIIKPASVVITDDTLTYVDMLVKSQYDYVDNCCIKVYDGTPGSWVNVKVSVEHDASGNVISSTDNFIEEHWFADFDKLLKKGSSVITVTYEDGSIEEFDCEIIGTLTVSLSKGTGTAVTP